MAEMKRCEQCGKFYNQEKEATCPHCSGASAAVDKTLPVMTNAVTGNDKTIATVGVTRAATDDERTQAVFRINTGIDPVVGWLICLTGSEKGRDYKVHSDNNYIGRSEKMDICIRGDETISRENHATITYDSRDRIFYFTPGEGRNIIRLNGKAVLTTSEIKANDKIELGKTELLFVPLCGENFDWMDLEEA
ncbi:MAG: FHA domain-containing protein [Lachnospiraceae bacterium]|nr:FHA domain-containing protein [Lachnospiraceae bacterium]